MIEPLQILVPPYLVLCDDVLISCSPGIGDAAACEAAADQVKEQRKTGSDKDSVYNWIIGVLIIVCLVLLMALALLCYRKG